MTLLNISEAFAELRENPLPEPPKAKRSHKRKVLAAWDVETDPFLYGRIPAPFCCGIAIGDNYFSFWGDDCLSQFLDFLLGYPEPLRIYAHNGGKFDFVFLLRSGFINLGDEIKIINGRIVEARIGKHVLRDSYAIIPVPLGNFDKLEIDYGIMESEEREKPANKAEILAYLKKDCQELLRLVTDFNDRFGPRLTIGGTAIKILREMHPFESITEEMDAELRPFYFGGRVQCFETGKVTGDLKVYDVNSMYPFVMAELQHFAAPYYEAGGDSLDVAGFICEKNIKPDTPYFLHFTGINRGALPTRTKAGLDFTVEEGEFFASSHEVQTALEFGLIEIHKVHKLLISEEPINFREFVETYISEKIKAKKEGNKVAELFAKLLLNSSYGKTAQNPDNYFDWALIDESELPEFVAKGYEVEFDYEDAGAMIVKRPTDEKNFFDVGIGASITGAARAVMLRAIVEAERPIYCDTDSLICEEMGNVPLDPYQLGAWDLEGRGDTCYVYGKKVYSLFDGDECKKMASKGVRLTGLEIKSLAEGNAVAYAQAAPTFKLNGDTEFTSRILGAEKHSKMYDKYGRKKVV